MDPCNAENVLSQEILNSKNRVFKIPQKALEIFQMDEFTGLPEEENAQRYFEKHKNNIFRELDLSVIL